jgi:hypothetical protein
MEGWFIAVENLVCHPVGFFLPIPRNDAALIPAAKGAAALPPTATWRRRGESLAAVLGREGLR